VKGVNKVKSVSQRVVCNNLEDCSGGSQVFHAIWGGFSVCAFSSTRMDPNFPFPHSHSFVIILNGKGG
jgi:hypothetical protein